MTFYCFIDPKSVVYTLQLIELPTIELQLIQLQLFNHWYTDQLHLNVNSYAIGGKAVNSSHLGILKTVNNCWIL